MSSNESLKKLQSFGCAHYSSLWLTVSDSKKVRTLSGVPFIIMFTIDIPPYLLDFIENPFPPYLSLYNTFFLHGTKLGPYCDQNDVLTILGVNSLFA